MKIEVHLQQVSIHVSSDDLKSALVEIYPNGPKFEFGANPLELRDIAAACNAFAEFLERRK